MALAIRKDPPSVAHGATVPAPALEASTLFRERLWSLLPVGGSLLIVSTLFWGPFLAPTVLGVGIIAFFSYWLVRSYGVAIASIVGFRRIRRWETTDWLARYVTWRRDQPSGRAWNWPRHVVIIPNYKESEEGLERTLRSLADQRNPRQVVVVLAMEAREAGADEKATRLVDRFRPHFANMIATFHPPGIPGETPGKGSNEAWAAREAFDRLIARTGDDLDRYTITSCDADAVFHPSHFAALNYLFLVNPRRYRTFWQPTIFNSNNIWDVPAPQRLLDGLSGINRLSNLLLPGSVKFPTSCYSLSWRMLREVDHWDEEVIPEDWHLYLKTCFMLGNDVHVEGLFLPLGNDCVLTDGYFKTLRAHYNQSVRHAWGCTDIPYAWRAAIGRTPLGVGRRLALAGAVTKAHMMWMAQWYLVTMGSQAPVALTHYAGASMPAWWLARDQIQLPGPSWHLGEIIRGDFSHPVGWMLWLTIANTLIYFCLFPLIAMIVVEFKSRPPRPAHVSRLQMAGGFLWWPLMAPVTFAFASLPALHAQLKLALGQQLVYRVAEKGWKHAPAAAHVPSPHAPILTPVPTHMEAESFAGVAGAGGS